MMLVNLIFDKLAECGQFKMAQSHIFQPPITAHIWLKKQLQQQPFLTQIVHTLLFYYFLVRFSGNIKEIYNYFSTTSWQSAPALKTLYQTGNIQPLLHILHLPSWYVYFILGMVGDSGHFEATNMVAAPGVLTINYPSVVIEKHFFMIIVRKSLVVLITDTVDCWRLCQWQWLVAVVSRFYFMLQMHLLL